jgi:hypothetical protein
MNVVYTDGHVALRQRLHPISPIGPISPISPIGPPMRMTMKRKRRRSAPIQLGIK